MDEFTPFQPVGDVDGSVGSGMAAESAAMPVSYVSRPKE